MVILIVILIIIAIPLVWAAFIPAPFTIVRDIVITRPKQQVFDYIKLLKNQELYSKWVMADRNMQLQFTGTDGTVGCVYAWQSNNKQVGQGEQEIIKLKDGDMVESEIRFLKPFDGISYTVFETAEIAPGKTHVKWIFNGTKKYPMKVMHLLCNLDKMLGRDMMISLGNLKTNLEK